MKNSFNKYKAFIFDLDGTVYRGDDIIPFADKTINTLQDEGRRVVFISNKTTGTVNDYFALLRNFGLKIDEKQIINSTVVVKKYLSENFSNQKFFAIGEKVFINEIVSAGLHYSEEPSKINILLVTLDRTLNYDKLEIAAKSLENGARFFAANIDDTCPVSGGEVLDAGATISALEKRTHRKLELNFGKPSKFMMDEVMSLLDTSLENILLIGDRIETDIAMGNNFGIDTALVSTGVKLYTNGTSSLKPTYHLDSIHDLIKT